MTGEMLKTSPKLKSQSKVKWDAREQVECQNLTGWMLVILFFSTVIHVLSYSLAGGGTAAPPPRRPPSGPELIYRVTT